MEGISQLFFFSLHFNLMGKLIEAKNLETINFFFGLDQGEESKENWVVHSAFVLTTEQAF